MKAAVEVILFDNNPDSLSSREAADALYDELKKALGFVKPSVIGNEAIWVARHLFPFETQEHKAIRDRAIRRAMSNPVSLYRKAGAR